MTWESYHAPTLRQLPKGSAVVARPGGIRATLPCKHGHSVDVDFGVMMPAAGIIKTLNKRGWKISKSRCLCPKHAAAKPKGQEMTQMAEALKAAQGQKPVLTALTTAASPNAKQAKRDALRWLDESFDTVAGRYKDGMSDAKIAEETGLSVKAVADLRAEFGYDLRTPPEIVAMQGEAEAIRDQIALLSANAGDILKRLVGLEQQLARYEAKP